MRTGIIGCGGRMGQMLVEEVVKTHECELSGGLEMSGHPALGQDISGFCGLDNCGVKISDDAKNLFANSDVIIDFSLPTGTNEYLALAVESGVALVLGTTGHDERQLIAIEEASKSVSIIKAMNFSIGMNIMFSITEKTSKLLGENTLKI